MITNAAGTVMRDMVFYPYGQVWRNIGNNWDLHFASMWQREFASGLDPTLNRMYHSRLFRWMTPDPVGGHTEDPQTLNRYAYVRNNPLNLIDPTGLDFYLACTQTRENSDTCQGGHAGVTTSDENGNKQFKETVVKSDKEGNLVDQYGARYSGTYSGQNVSFTQEGSKDSYIGQWKQNSDPTSGIKGAGLFEGFNFTFENTEAAQTLRARWEFQGTRAQAQEALERTGYSHWAIGGHKNQTEYRSPEVRGRDSIHYSINKRGTDAKRTVPTTGDMHAGEYNPGTDVVSAFGHLIYDQ